MSTESEPRTEAGRELLDMSLGYMDQRTVIRAITAIEAEAEETAMVAAFEDVQRIDRAEAHANNSPDAPGAVTFDHIDEEPPDGPVPIDPPENAPSPSVALDELRPFLLHAVNSAIVNAMTEYASLAEGTDR